jgi:hypothetical protein
VEFFKHGYQLGVNIKNFFVKLHPEDPVFVEVPKVSPFPSLPFSLIVSRHSSILYSIPVFVEVPNVFPFLFSSFFLTRLITPRFSILL